MGSSLTLMADFKFSHSTPRKYNWQRRSSESALALNSFKPPRMGMKRTGNILTLFMASFGNCVSIHSFCSIGSPLSHTSPMFRFSISNSNTLQASGAIMQRVGGKHQGSLHTERMRKMSPSSFLFAGDPAPLFTEHSLSFWQDQTYSNSLSTSLTFVPLSSCP